MIQRYITPILYITGVATMLPLLQYFAPHLALSLSAMTVSDPVGLMFVQQAGMLIFCIGALLVYAARHPVHRRPVIWAALLEKLGFCVLIVMGWNNPALQGLHLIVFFDMACVLLYAIYLFTPERTA